jgi:hypothetical protein
MSLMNALLPQKRNVRSEGHLAKEGGGKESEEIFRDLKMFDSLEKMDRTLNIGHSPSFVFVHPIGQCTFGHHHNVGATHLAGKRKK